MQRVTIAPDQLHQQQISLTDAQIHYLQRVLRLKVGDRFIALDGQGQGWVAVLEANAYQATVLAVWQMDLELPIRLQLIIAMPKTGMDDMVRQTTELGVTTIQPVVSDRTLLKPSAKKIERWRRIAQEAMEQSERQCVPVIHEPVSLVVGLAQTPADYQWLCVARQPTDCPAPLLLSELLAQSLFQPSSEVDVTKSQTAKPQTAKPQAFKTITLAIGPEGGWSKSEVERAIALNYRPVSLGPRILRTVTAPLAAIAIIAAVMDHQKSTL
ncbi:MAG: 16S rRNA (uracil(1498)-N(3))-methyltransferase [Cyanothece sp. SIO2G6]|nr:16S rRNA (uracil(1498)-N(3))-methyltransferase [Cyanothece sp. SIO2G6]